MEIKFKETFKKIPFPIAIWEIKNDNLNKIFINDAFINSDYCGVIENKNVENISVENRVQKFNVKNANNFQNFLLNKKKTILDTACYDIVLDFIDDKTFFEIFYPKCDTDYILSSISYKIRNPLTNIVGILPIIQNFNDDSQFQNYVDIVKKSSSDIISVANDIIDIFNIRQNNIVVKKEDIDINELIEDCFKIISREAKKKKLSLSSDISKGIPKIIYSDKSKIKQIILNLIENSVKYTKVGGIIINVSIDKKYPIKGNMMKYKLLFKIKDTGIGMNDDKMKIIDAILGINNEEKMTTHKLTGFGLYICKNMCNLLEGDIWLKSEEDIGTVAYFTVICEALIKKGL